MVGESIQQYIPSLLSLIAHGAESLGGKFPHNMLPWNQLPAKLAGHGIICINYPSGVPWPGDQPKKNGRVKGISNIGKAAQQVVLNAFSDPDYPLMLKAAFRDKDGKRERRAALSITYRLLSDLLNSEKPVIFEAPPPADSKYARGRRRFANGTDDHNGVPRRGASRAKTTVKPKQVKTRPAQHAAPKTVIEVSSEHEQDHAARDTPSPPPKKRLTARPGVVAVPRKAQLTTEVVLPQSHSLKRSKARQQEGDKASSGEEDNSDSPLPIKPAARKRQKIKPLFILNSSEEEAELSDSSKRVAKRLGKQKEVAAPSKAAGKRKGAALTDQGAANKRLKKVRYMTPTQDSAAGEYNNETQVR